jgi:Carboxypeptidase regulatory-like domain
MRFRKLLLASVCTLATAVHAQTSRGTVTATGLDASAAVIAGAYVTLTGIETGLRRSTDTNEAGIYRFDAVDLGVYQLGVTHTGFQPFLGSGISVEANRVTTFD